MRVGAGPDGGGENLLRAGTVCFPAFLCSSCQSSFSDSGRERTDPRMLGPQIPTYLGENVGIYYTLPWEGWEGWEGWEESDTH